MGQTLTHGIYLPDEGERNCYDGLASNWSILDGAVGTIAEHTNQIAGKAPAVHTHTKADITDFPVYGTTAGTICEGNDSRLSDARTPVAHTHTKADVTDLLNSNFIPSANNSYDLGSSSYQWNNLYAKNYYYNGVVWGLDKANEWTGNNSYTGIVSLDSSSDVAEQFKQKLPKDVSASSDAMARVNSLVDSAGHYVVVETIGHWSNYVAKNITLKYKNDSAKQRAIEFRLYSDGTGILYPQTPFECDLGNAYNKWKTLNGINPGALSLPSGGTTENTDWFNVAGDILPTGGNATSFSIATANYFTPAKDGWLALAVKQCSELSVWCENLKYGISIVAPDTSLSRQVVIPVVAGKIYQILITGNSWASARLIMPKGNV